jgi:DNA-binding NtrC family response regulator
MGDSVEGESTAVDGKITPRDFARFNLVGESPAFRSVLQLAERMSRCDATVLIQGETGTGKELAARAIHYLGRRGTAPFVPVNCGALPESLVESELFGHARGAFTDAKEAHEGMVAQARGGTLLLDEVDALSPRSQVALLRFLQDQEYRPVGGAALRRADVRVIATTNSDLAALAARGQYRQDLLFRLDVLSLQIPPLRERQGDVRLLAELFLERLSRQYQVPPKVLHPDTHDLLARHRWPGNVRELENRLHRAFLLCDGPVIRLTSIGSHSVEDGSKPAEPITDVRFRVAKARAIADFERAYVVELLSRTRGNLSLASRISGKERSRLGKLVRKYGLTRKAFGENLQ